MSRPSKLALYATALTALASTPVLAQAPNRPIFGTVNSVNAAAGTISVTTMQGDTGTVHITRSTLINTSKTIAASDLKVGDRVQVMGMPTGITANTIIDGDMQAALPSFGGFRGRPGGPGGPGGPGAFRGGPGGPGGPGGTFASASGVVTSVSPLSIDLGGGTTLTVTPSPDAKITEIVPESIGDIKSGDRVIAAGSIGDDGSMTADKVAVNLMPGRGPMGGRPGGG